MDGAFKFQLSDLSVVEELPEKSPTVLLLFCNRDMCMHVCVCVSVCIFLYSLYNKKT